MPPHTRILLADVAVGSDTPSLVGNVLKWRQANPKDANDLWTSLDGENQQFGKILNRLSTGWENNRTLYEEVANYLSSMQQIQVSSASFGSRVVADPSCIHSFTVVSQSGPAERPAITYQSFREASYRI
jgi:phosphomevalonate kinase